MRYGTHLGIVAVLLGLVAAAPTLTPHHTGPAASAPDVLPAVQQDGAVIGAVDA
jgi:hypothetical protein